MKQKRVLLFTGNGKGKSTAAFGMLARTLGHGMNVKARVIQFVKAQSGVGEMLFFSRFSNVVWNHYGRGFLPRDPESPEMEAHRIAAEEGLHEAIEAMRSLEYDFVLLDEVCFALSQHLIPVAPLVEAILEAREGKIIVLTGRNAPQELIDVADTVTEMRMVKHGFEKGMPAKPGVER